MIMNQIEHIETFNGLSEGKQLAVLSLLSSPTYKVAARAAGIGRTTLYRWMQEPAFKEALADTRRELQGSYTLRLVSIADKAVGALERAVECGETQHEIRAAHEILERIDKRLELEDLAVEIERLKEAAGIQ
jgi:hypothetical protein